MSAVRLPNDVLRDAIDVSLLRGDQRRVARFELALIDHRAGLCTAHAAGRDCAAVELANDILEGRA